MGIIKSKFLKSLSDYKSFNAELLPQIAVVGRSNVGKSSFINAITIKKKLAKTSSTPGKTRLINIFLINESFYLIDLPGYGYARVSKQEKAKWAKMMEDYFDLSKELCHVFHIVDIRHTPTKDDIIMADYLKARRIPFTVIATKADKISKSQYHKNTTNISINLSVQPWDIILFSSKNLIGKEKIDFKIDEIIDNLS